MNVGRAHLGILCEIGFDLGGNSRIVDIAAGALLRRCCGTSRCGGDQSGRKNRDQRVSFECNQGVFNFVHKISSSSFWCWVENASADEAAAHHEVDDQYDNYNAGHAHAAASVMSRSIAVKSAATEKQNQQNDNQQHRGLPYFSLVRATASLAEPIKTIEARPIS